MSKSDKAPTCRCAAYKFPHRFMSGDCSGWTAVEAVWEESRKCLDCPYYQLDFQETVEEPSEAFCRLLKHQKGHLPGQCPELGLIVKEK